MSTIDRATGYRLLETGTAVEFRIKNTQIHEASDPAEFGVEIELEFPPDPETEDNDLEWGAFGLLFVIGTLSFADARPRELSVIEYLPNDEFHVADLIDCLHWERDKLHFSADYVRGRRMKTDVVLRASGSGKLTTVGRGKAPILWLERLKGKKLLRVVDK